MTTGSSTGGSPCPHYPSTPTRSSSPRRARPKPEAQTPASVTIIDQQRDRAARRAARQLRCFALRPRQRSRLGPAGSLTEVRIRGAEANHTLLFIDGIRDQRPRLRRHARFEILNADLASRIEVVRGPQSRSVGLRSDRRRDRRQRPRRRARLCSAAPRADRSAFAGRARPAAIDHGRCQPVAARSACSARPASTASECPAATRTAIETCRAGCAGPGTLGRTIELGAAAIALTGRSQFDGYDPITFAHTDTLDSTPQPARGGAHLGRARRRRTPWRGQVAGSLLGSSNRNILPASRQPDERSAANYRAQLERRFRTGSIAAPADHCRRNRSAKHSTPAARIYGGLSDQDRSRNA